jgi:hypothetical protein
VRAAKEGALLEVGPRDDVRRSPRRGGNTNASLGCEHAQPAFALGGGQVADGRERELQGGRKRRVVPALTRPRAGRASGRIAAEHEAIGLEEGGVVGEKTLE